MVILGFILLGGAVVAGLDGMGDFGGLVVALMIPGIVVWGGMSLIGGMMTPTTISVVTTALVVCIGMPLMHMAISRYRSGVNDEGIGPAVAQLTLTFVWAAADLTFIAVPFRHMFTDLTPQQLSLNQSINELKVIVGLIGLGFGAWAYVVWSNARKAFA